MCVYVGKVTQAAPSILWDMQMQVMAMILMMALAGCSWSTMALSVGALRSKPRSQSQQWKLSILPSQKLDVRLSQGNIYSKISVFFSLYLLACLQTTKAQLPSPSSHLNIKEQS